MPGTPYIATVRVELLHGQHADREKEPSRPKPKERRERAVDYEEDQMPPHEDVRHLGIQQHKEVIGGGDAKECGIYPGCKPV